MTHVDEVLMAPILAGGYKIVVLLSKIGTAHTGYSGYTVELGGVSGPGCIRYIIIWVYMII